MSMLPSIQEASPSKLKGSATEIRWGKGAPLRPASSKSATHSGRQANSVSLESSPEKKIQSAFTAIQDAYIEKVSSLEETIEHWMKKCSTLESKVEELEAFSNELQTKLATSQTNYQELSGKHDTLLNSQNQLVDKYNQLRRYALELDNFKKNIINLSSPNLVSIDTDLIDQSIAIEGEELVPKTNGTSDYPKYASGKFKATSPPVEIKGSWHKFSSARNLHESDSRLHKLSGKKEADSYLENKSRFIYNKINESESHEEGQYREARKAKAIEIYDRILADIEPEDYERFSNAIEDYNNNIISHQDALKVFRQVIQNDRDFEEMKEVLLETRADD